MNPEHFYRARYHQSHAVVVGINQYEHEAPLQFAVNDAQAVRDTLVERFGFDPANITLLLDGQATSAAILGAMRHLGRTTEVDDRVVFFFAGHGHTIQGRAGDVGFLVPYESDPADDATLLAWRTLVDTTQLIRAKHVLFIMDACYSGLATSRKPSPGATRFVRDLLLRRSAQVITAGKANQVVDDAGGPRAGHSIFTGHLLNGMDGEATTAEGVLTAQGLMAYVYRTVGQDPNSQQTPHYGSFDGEGDLVFSAPDLGVGHDAEEIGTDTFIVLPHVEQDILPQDALTAKVGRAKMLLSSEAGAIELHDLLMDEVRHFLTETADDAFPLMDTPQAKDVAERIDRYDRAVMRMSVVTASVAYWGGPAHRQALQKTFARATDRIERVSGNTGYLALRWFPILTAFYACGIAAVDAGRFDNLVALFSVALPRPSIGSLNSPTLLDAMGEAIPELNRAGVMKMLPSLSKKILPVSEYLFQILQARLDDALYLGKNYEVAFDTFEQIFFIACIDANVRTGQAPWGPIGRFKFKHTFNGNPTYVSFMQTVKGEGIDWAPLKAGLFGGDIFRLNEALESGKNLMSLPMHT